MSRVLKHEDPLKKEVQVVQHRGDAGIRRRCRPVILLGLLDGLAGIEGRELRILTVAKGDKSQIAEMLLLGIGDNHVGGAFWGDSFAVG